MNIIEAVESNDIKYIKDNIDKFNPNQVGEYGFPLLHRAAYLGHLEIIDMLIDNGANIEITDEYGDTALFSVIDDCERNWFYVIELLLKKGAKVTGQMLIEAVKQEKLIDVIQLFLENGADVHEYDSDGDQAINYAYDLNYFDAITLLENMELVITEKPLLMNKF